MEIEERLIRSLLNESCETPWLEFKLNLSEPEEIGEYISALGNSAACESHEHAYLIWGIDDKTHEILGTTFNPYLFKIGNEELENWLHHLLSPNAVFEYTQLQLDGKNIVIFSIQQAIQMPITFKKEAYIRSGSYKKHLRDIPSLEVKLWNKLSQTKYETLSAIENLTETEVLEKLHYTTYFDLVNIPLPSTSEQILHYLVEDFLVQKQDNGLYTITNTGALLFAKKLSLIPSLARKCLRVVQYRDNTRLSIKEETTFEGGYASSFEEIIRYVGALLPKTESLSDGIRKLHPHFPEIIVRELTANALVHQDLVTQGTGPVFEIFETRFEITNPGIPLIDIQRIIDNPPRSRNELLAALLRRFHICEELGTGWDKIVAACESDFLPVPKIITYQDATRVIVSEKLPFEKIPNEDKIQACYLHSCLRYINTSGGGINNSTLRERFNVAQKDKSKISRLIKATCDAGLIKPLDVNTAPRYLRYIPFWA